MVWGLIWAYSAGAQTPSTEQMIEQLQRPATRGLRNLTVESAPKNLNANDSYGSNRHNNGVNSPQSAPNLEVNSSNNSSVSSKPSLSLLIQFDFNSAKVKTESHQALANLSQALQSPQLQASKFAIEGHTDAKGGLDYNRRLSEQRALAVREFLRIQGVSETRLLASGKGSSELANAADPLAAENRRVRIVNLD
jgi:outer membrane protein OmpA-like peptidoglycan-associated protein